jgi:hypothetical protein
LRSQKKFAMAMIPPTKMPNPVLAGKKIKLAKVRISSNARLPLMMTAKMLSSFILVIIPVDLPAGYHVDVLEAGCNADKEKDKKEPWFRTEPAIKRQTEPNPDRDGQGDRDAQTRYYGKVAEKLFIVIVHDWSRMQIDARNRYSISRQM